MNEDNLVRAFDILENHDEVWEKNEYDDIWAINHDIAYQVLDDNDVANIDDVIDVIADYYTVDIL